MRNFLFVILCWCLHAVAAETNDDPFGCARIDGESRVEACNLAGAISVADRALDTACGAQCMKPDRGHAMMKAQQAWLAYRAKACALEQDVWGGIAYVNDLRCKLWMAEERISYLHHLDQVANAERYWPAPDMHSGAAPSLPEGCEKDASPLPDHCARLAPLPVLEQHLVLVHQAALAAIDDAAALDATHAAWLRLRDATCAVEKARTGAYLVQPDLCLRRMTAERVDYLKMSYTSCRAAETTPACFRPR